MTIQKFSGASWACQTVFILLWMLVSAEVVQQQLRGSNTTEADIERRRQKPVIVVLGTAGSGTRTIHQVLAAAGVWMHPYTNKEFDSKLFIKKIKHTPPFGMPKWKSGMMWETRHAPAYYEPQQLSGDIRRKLEHAHRMVAAEFLADVPDDVAVWGWKEPQAIFTLPFLVQVFPNLHIIHQTRDGRDVALSNLNSTSRRMTQPYQRHYVRLISGQNITDSQLFTPRFTVAAGLTWSAVNSNARRWVLEHGLGLQGRYSLTRLEDFCDGSTLHDTVRKVLRHAAVTYTSAQVDAAAAAINFTKCQTDRWQAAWASRDQELTSAVRRLDADIGDALEMFGYNTRMRPGWLDNEAMRSQLHELSAVQDAAARLGTAGQQPLVVVFVGGGEAHLLQPWLTAFSRSGADVATLVIIWQGVSEAVLAPGSQGLAGPNAAQPSQLLLPLHDAAAAVGPPSNNSRLLEQLHVLHELHKLGIAVVVADLDTLWVKDAAAHMQQLTASTLSDMVIAPCVLPVDVSAARSHPAGSRQVQEQLKAAQQAGKDGVGLLFINSTQPAGAVLRGMLRQQLQHWPLHSLWQNRSDAHGPRSLSLQLQARPGSLLLALQHHLLMANLVFGKPQQGPDRPLHDPLQQDGAEGDSDNSEAVDEQPLLGVQATTAPHPLQVMLLPAAQVGQPCSPTGTSSSRGRGVLLTCVTVNHPHVQQRGSSPDPAVLVQQ